MANHPEYLDIEFKPSIAQFDWDQTYDVMGFPYIFSSAENLMKSLNLPVVGGGFALLIDRFTPFLYPWADEYSTKYYNFLKKFNFTPLNSIGQRIIRKNLTQEILAVIPPFNYDGDIYDKNAEYLIDLEKGKYCLTFLVSHPFSLTMGTDLVNPSFLRNLGAYVVHQATVLFFVTSDRQINLNKIINSKVKDDYLLYTLKTAQNGREIDTDLENATNIVSNTDSMFCVNSLVLSKYSEEKKWVKQTLQLPIYMAYDTIDDYFGQIETKLEQYFSDIYSEYNTIDDGTGLPVVYPLGQYPSNLTKNTKPKLLQANNNLNNLPINYQYYESDYQVTLSEFPQHYKDYCYLHYANNNKWKTGEIKADLGFNHRYHVLDFPRTRWISPLGELADIEFNLRRNPQNTSTDRTVNFANILRFPMPSIIGATGGMVGHTTVARRDLIPNTFLLFRQNLFGRSIYYGNNAFAERTGWQWISQVQQDYTLLVTQEHTTEPVTQGNIITRYSDLVRQIYTGNISYERKFETGGAYVSETLPTLSEINFENISTRTQVNTETGGQQPGLVTGTVKDLSIIDDFAGSTVDINLYSSNQLTALMDNFYSLSDNELVTRIKKYYEDNERWLITMVDSVRIKEIHAMLGAAEYALDQNGDPVYMSIARNVDLLAKALGINYNPDGTKLEVDLNNPPQADD